jgi:hypothetical protein
VRKASAYPKAKEVFKVMMGKEGDEDGHEHGETMYILRCLDTECSTTSLYTALNHYPSELINTILLDDFKYSGNKVLKNKANLLIVCETVLDLYNMEEEV